MAVDIIVRKEPCGPYKHEDVVEPLLGNSEEAALCLGESVLNQNGSGLQGIDYLVVYKPGIQCGKIVKLYDTLVGNWVYGKIVSVEHRIERRNGTAVVQMSKVRIERPTEFFTKPV